MSETSNVHDFGTAAKRADPRPVIRLGTDLQSTVDKAEAALIASDRGLYQRGNFIVCVDRANVITADGSEIEAQHIREREEHALLEDLSVVARFEKYSKTEKAWVATSPTMDIVRTLKQRRGRLRLPTLSGVINAPTLRSDGSILEIPGYDRPTGLLFNPGTTKFWNVKQNVSRADAEGALGELQRLICTFPFEDGADRSVALAVIMTAVVRRSLPTAPLFGFSAPVAGSGKSMLVDIASVIATGRMAGVLATGKTDEETEKRLVSALLEGRGLIAVDNCEQPLGGDLLCQMLTQQTVSVRPLGKSEMVELPTSALITATGNNLILIGDMTRRALVCKLDPQVERPELRTFSNNPVEDAKAQRGRYVSAVLTVLGAYIAAGKPDRVKPLGSFEAWSDLVRSALMWLGCADPVDTMEKVRMDDPNTVGRQTVMGQCRKALYGRFSVGGAIKIAEGNPAFHDALLLVAGMSDKINHVRLGKWLGKNKNLIVTLPGDNGGPPIQCCFREAGVSDGNKMWQLQEK